MAARIIGKTIHGAVIYQGTEGDRLAMIDVVDIGARIFKQPDGLIWESNGAGGWTDITTVATSGGGGDSSPNTLAQPITFNALQAWQRYEFPAGANITYIVAQNTHATETMLVYLDADSTPARDAICGTNGAPPTNNLPIPGLFYVPPLTTIVYPLQAALSNGAYGGGVIDARLKNTAAAASDNMITAG